MLENPKGDNRLDLDKLKRVSSSIFGTNNTLLRFFNGSTGENWFWPHLYALKSNQIKSNLASYAANFCHKTTQASVNLPQHFLHTNVASWHTLL